MQVTLRWPSAAALPAFVLSLLALAKGSLWAEHRNPQRIHHTSYLDGLRGLASLIVTICHYTEDNHDYFVPAWGLNKTSSIIQLPFVRLIYSGRPMVHVFFIISGFVLSYKPLKAIQAADLEKCHSLLASSALRRPIRLFGPCVVSTFAILVLTYIGCLYDPMPTLWQQLEDWWFALFRNITWPWAWDQDLRPTYDIHLWSIPVEFVHSMFLFTVLLVLAPLRRPVRISSLGLIMFYCLCCGRWAAFEFLGGCLIADSVLTRQASPEQIKLDTFTKDEEVAIAIADVDNDASNPADITANTDLHATFQLICPAILVLLWWFISGWPNENGDQTPIIRFLHRHTPEPFANMVIDDRSPQKFWFALSALGLVWAITRLDVLQRLLEARWPQYLGRISYALYIVHGPILNMLQRRVMGHVAIAARGSKGAAGFQAAVAGAGIKGLIGVVGPTSQFIAWALGMVVMGPLILGAADVFCRFVDMPIMAVARRFEEWSIEG